MDTSSSSLPLNSGSKSLNRVAIIGATGYGGFQAINVLKNHPFFDISYLAADRSAGNRWSSICPFIRIDPDISVVKPDPDDISREADFAILSLPNGLASQLVPELISRDIRVVDLSADYRFPNLSEWSQIYNQESKKYVRQDNQLCEEAVYGLPELNSAEISKARLVASPGCFPTASLLALLPFLKQGLIDNDGIIIDAKTGTSGGGRVPKENLLLSEASEAIAPYGVIGHRHTPEIERIASEVAGHEIQVQFTPHLVPMVRGLLSSVYARLRDPGLTADDCRTVMESFYRDYSSVEILPVGVYPSTKWVKQTNKALISVQVDSRTGRIIIMSAIDNLLKGQAAQAIQCLNLMSNLPLDTGININNFYP